MDEKLKVFTNQKLAGWQDEGLAGGHVGQGRQE